MEDRDPILSIKSYLFVGNLVERFCSNNMTCSSSIRWGVWVWYNECICSGVEEFFFY